MQSQMAAATELLLLLLPVGWSETKIGSTSFHYRKLTSAVLVADEVVSDLEANHAQQQEGREEGVEEDKVKCVSRQSARIALIDDRIALSDQTGPWQRFGDICNHTAQHREMVNNCLFLKTHTHTPSERSTGSAAKSANSVCQLINVLPSVHEQRTLI